MISWTVATTYPFTRSEGFSFSSSVSISNGQSNSNTFELPTSATEGLLSSVGTGQRNFSRSYSEQTSGSTNENGTTTGSTMSVTETDSEFSSVTYINLNTAFNFSTGGTTSTSSSSSFSTSEVLLPNTIQAETSTTDAQLLSVVNAPESYVTTGLVWTTVTSDNDQTTEFTLSEGDVTEWSVSYSDITVTIDAVTTISDTTVAPTFATVVQAAASEVLYFIPNRATTWGGYLAATNIAESGSRFTIVPSFSTTQITVFDAASQSTSTTTSHEEISYELSFRASRSTMVTRSVVMNQAFLPNTTTTQNAVTMTTQASFISGVVFGSQIFSIGRSNLANTSESLTTSIVTSYATRPTTVSRTRGTVVFDSIVSTTTSAWRFLAVNAPATLVTSEQSTASTSSGQSISESGTTISVAGNQAVMGAAQITTGIGPNIGRSRFVEAGVAFGSQRGLFFTASPQPANPLFVVTARAGNDPRATLLFPEQQIYTLNSDTISYLTTKTRTPDSANSDTFEPTTSSLVFGVAGQTFVTEDPLTNNRPQHHGAHSVGANYTIIDEAGQGAYKDQIAGTTTSFNGQATAYTAGDNAEIRSWFPVTHIAPLVLSTARNGITFSVARNSLGLPLA